MATGQVLRAQRAIRQAPDTRAIKRELTGRNPYMRAWLGRKGYLVFGTTIVRAVGEPITEVRP